MDSKILKTFVPRPLIAVLPVPSEHTMMFFAMRESPFLEAASSVRCPSVAVTAAFGPLAPGGVSSSSLVPRQRGDSRPNGL